LTSQQQCNHNGERKMTNQQPSKPGNPSSPSYVQRMLARMTREEAVKGVTRMMLAYPNFRCSEETIATMAEALMGFPREVATAACSPIHGAVRLSPAFPVSVPQVVEWCEREGEWLSRMARHEAVGLPPPAPPDRSGRPTLAETIARAARIMGRSVKADGTLGPSQAMVEQIEADKAAQRALLARLDEKVRKDLIENGAPVTSWGPLSPELGEIIRRPSAATAGPARPA
jgi:hypothetical protein